MKQGEITVANVITCIKANNVIHSCLCGIRTLSQSLQSTLPIPEPLLALRSGYLLWQ